METQRKLPHEGESLETPVYFLKNQQTGEFERR